MGYRVQGLIMGFRVEGSEFKICLGVRVVLAVVTMKGK